MPTLTQTYMLATLALTAGWSAPLRLAPSAVRGAIMLADPLATRDAAPPSAGEAAAAVTAWQGAALGKVASTLGLVAKDYPEEMGFASFTIAGATGSIESFEGPGAPNVAWCSGLSMAGADSARGSVTAFCGPLTDVPHLIAQCGVSDGGASVDLYIDFRPRAESGYDPSLPSLADYPDPTTREAFAEGSNRKDFASAFFTEEVEAWRADLLSLPGATLAAPMSKEQTASISAGPMLIDLKLPASAANAAAAAEACTAAVDRWLGWMTGAEEMKRGLSAGMRQTATYTRDTKVRANHFGFLMGRYSALFGDVDGKALAAADAGPLDEAYVGGGS